ncbi:MAG: type IV-A pilus assembly ATPase PilB, partial [Gammaproteobacteria bacterium]|nr:type IV-A pilus assembly ATPase PilB [Gammaproteobacteria bacterium]
MATQSAQVKLSGLARKLVQDGLLPELDAIKHHEQALKKKMPFVSFLVEQNLLSSSDIANVAAHEFGMPLLDLAVLDIDSET